MAYRSFKRVLVETSLERKCLMLFGVSLLIVLACAFWFVERNAEKLISDTARQIGRNFSDLSLLRHHIRTSKYLWNHIAEPFKELDEQIVSQNYDWEFIALEEDSLFVKMASPRTRVAKGKEVKVVEDLMYQLLDQVQARQDQADQIKAEQLDRPLVARNVEGSTSSISNSTDPPEPNRDPLAKLDEKLEPVSVVKYESENYMYYQPIYWKSVCINCHEDQHNSDVFGPTTEPTELRGPVRVIRITIPDSAMDIAVTKNRAILFTTAIITVFLAITALYLIVRFVIIRPLSHLRDVSDEISRGNTDLRADIQTNDEFEDLAASFNRMLRHLVEAQEELQTLNQDLDSKVDELAQANMSLHEMNRLKSEFLANMSHELRTPLNSIIGFSDVLRGIDALNNKQKRYVENIGNSGRVLLEMINDILDLAKMESGKMNVKLSQFDISRVVHAQCDLVRALAEEKNIDMELQVEKDLPAMSQDQAKVQQILTNLLSNAIKFTPEGGRIDVSIKRTEDDQLLMQVKDTGIGIAEEDRQVIFEKFRQANVGHGEDNLTREFSGTGLGLSIVKELSRLLGGRISFESELGKGSSFNVLMPWKLDEQPRTTNDLAARLDEVTKTNRIEFRHANEPNEVATSNPGEA